MVIFKILFCDNVICKNGINLYKIISAIINLLIADKFTLMLKFEFLYKKIVSKGKPVGKTDFLENSVFKIIS